MTLVVGKIGLKLLHFQTKKTESNDCKLAVQDRPEIMMKHTLGNLIKKKYCDENLRYLTGLH
jgi:hypothetical protein